jgi:RNA 3'-terminal phosphate cyclase (ATP)
VAGGGTDTLHAPTINYMSNVLLPTLARVGVHAEIMVDRYGYYPKGNADATLTVKPAPLKSLKMVPSGKPATINGISVCTYLSDRQVAERQAKAASQTLIQKGYPNNIQIINDQSTPVQKGSSIALWAKEMQGNLLGSDAIGELRKTAEAVGKEAAEKLLVELATGASVDVFLADMLIPYMALSKGESVLFVREISEHIEANVWLMEKLLGVGFNVKREGNLFRIAKIDAASSMP